MTDTTVINDDGEIVDVSILHGEEATLAALANPSLSVALSRAELDQQITTARAFPRSISRVISNIATLATLDEDTAESCMYALPRGGKAIQGPSIRLAEIIASQWGNQRSGARVVHVDRDEKVVIAEGVFHDLETNSATKMEVRRRIVDSKGRLYNDDMIVVTGNAACAIAKRNAILGGVPRGIWSPAYDRCLRVVAGTIETLAATREKSIKYMANWGMTPEEVFAAIGVTGPDDITLQHIPIIRGMASALKNGEATVEEIRNRTKGSETTKAPIGNPLSAGRAPKSSQKAQEADPKAEGAKTPADGGTVSGDQPVKEQDPIPPSAIELLEAAFAKAQTIEDVDAVVAEFRDRINALPSAQKTAARRLEAAARDRIPSADEKL